MARTCAAPMTDISTLADCRAHPCPCQLALVTGCDCGKFHDPTRSIHADNCKTKETS